VPVWAAIVIGLGSGVVGTVLSTVLRISYERETELRQRGIQAADDFAVQGARIFAAVDEAITARDDSTPNEEAAMDAARAVLRETEARVVRLQLLFGPDSPAAETAAGVVSCLFAAIGELREWPPDWGERMEVTPDMTPEELDEEGSRAYESAWEDAIDEARMWEDFGLQTFHRFTREASEQLRRPWRPGRRRRPRLRRRSPSTTPRR
jgi:hypothetical protein